jgi:drug/metabolite transporter (DMT)-like permease
LKRAAALASAVVLRLYVFARASLGALSPRSIRSRMPLNSIALGAFILCLSAGQLLFKQSALNSVGQGLLRSLLFDPVFYAALALYGVTTLLYIWILTRIPLSTAYLFVAGAMILVPVLSNYLFHEPLTARFWAGAALIIAGLLVINPIT